MATELAGHSPIAATTEQERQVFAKITWRLLPILIVGYIFNYLDRNNISFAALTMNREIGLTATEFGVGAGVLFLGYCLFEVPSNLALYHFGARRWISRIMISWGLISAATIFVVGPYSFYALRFLLGVAEAGFFPGVAFYLSTWFPSVYRTRVIAWFMVSIPVSSVIAGPVSSLLLQMDGIAGLAGWKWLFLLEALPVVFIGIAMLWILAERPETARWLSPEERQLVADRLNAERREKEVRRLSSAFLDPRVLILAGVQFGFLVGSYGLGIWLPLILREANLTDIEIGFATSGCYLIATIGMVLWAGNVDRLGGKVRNLTRACLLSAIGLVGTVAFDSFWLSLTSFTISLIGINAARGIFWTIPPRFLSGIAAAGGLAFINSIGTMGGFVGPTLMGWLTDRTGSFAAGLAAMSAFLLMATVLSWSLKRFGADRL